MGGRALLLVAGLFVASVGDRFADIAFALHAAETGSSALLAAILLASAVPEMLLGLVGGVVADRHLRAWWWPAALAVQAAVLIALAHLHTPWHLVAGVALNGSITALLGPVGSKLLGALCRGREERAARAHTAATGAAAVVGTALGGVSFAAGSRGTLLVVAGCALLVLAVCAAAVARGAVIARAAPAGRASALLGFRRLASPAVFGATGALCTVGVLLGTSVEAVAGVFVLTGFTGMGPGGYGPALAAWSAGVAAGAALAGGWARRRAAMPVSAMAMGAAIALPALAPLPWAALAAFAVGGLANGVFNTALATAIWTRVAPAEHGRAWAAFRWTLTACLLTGHLLGAAAGAGGARALMVCSGTATVLAGAAFLLARLRTPGGEPAAAP
ncbi:hypothetical protein [Nocardiopsis changdeensis]|uniref:hypothetical protein n=1 Tax=Nocardiopsis changdeensis TaxID=2831969 RepID=UPI003F447E2A